METIASAGVGGRGRSMVLVFTGSQRHVEQRQADQPHADLGAEEIAAGRIERQRHAGPAGIARLPICRGRLGLGDEARRHQPFGKVGHCGTGQRQAARDLGARQAALAAQQAQDPPFVHVANEALTGHRPKNPLTRH